MPNPEKNVTLSLSMDAVLFLKQLVGSLTLPVKNGNLVKTATVIEEVQEALGNVAVIQGG